MIKSGLLLRFSVLTRLPNELIVEEVRSCGIDAFERYQLFQSLRRTRNVYLSKDANVCPLADWIDSMVLKVKKVGWNATAVVAESPGSKAQIGDINVTLGNLILAVVDRKILGDLR